jgi:hypothetical protein
MSDVWFQEAMRLKEELVRAVRALQFNGTAADYRKADEALIAHMLKVPPGVTGPRGETLPPADASASSSETGQQENGNG